MTRPARKFSRIQPELRREHLVEAALRCLADHGHAGVSVRKIAAEAGVSIGLINHHYDSIDQLIAHAYETLAAGIFNRVTRAVDPTAGTAREKFSAFFRAYFSPDVFDPKLLGVWVVFWSMIRHSPAIKAAHDRTNAGYTRVLEGYLTDLAAENGQSPATVRLAVVGLSALLDGIWLQWCLTPEQAFTIPEAIAVAESWIDGLAHGAYGRLAS
ncbi:TetR/AcrR family transcriptional regulator [Nitrospirillum sp. BR 11163]|uniref:TetR/AcrR family transcriptional regulator n=1 Tax=Nitrospirillum sp. BR 11163 TaxID=3104323 RepID=UPI002AFFF288|nr:TetR family transcriptional regulator C-terminal domain-containing protein [Nitrospirillum sp. BR 11163]MEA1675892.1 TetR family transcriptional regulator C-terminal domain-containing protein [Nitrospirillum sp. BR 11163]